MKILAVCAILIGLVGLTACNPSLLGSNGSGGGSNSGISTGNWAFATTSAGGAGNDVIMGGYLNSSGSSVTGNLFVFGTQFFPLGPSTAPMPVTGTISGATLTLSGTLNSSAFTFTFPLPSGTITSLSGNYAVTGGGLDGDSGTVAGAIAGSFSGTWSGTIAASGGTMAVSMSQSSTPNSNGSFTISSTGTGVTFSGVTGCTVTGTLDSTNSFAAGGMTVLSFNTTDQGIAGHLLYVGIADDPTAPTSMTDSYIYTGGSTCMLVNTGQQQFGLTLTKQ